MNNQDDGKTPNAASDILQGLFESLGSPLANSFRRYRLKQKWESIVGKTIASECSPTGYYNGILYVSVKNSSWVSQLFHVRKELIKKINSSIGSEFVKQIRFNQNWQAERAGEELKTD